MNIFTLLPLTTISSINTHKQLSKTNKRMSRKPLIAYVSQGLVIINPDEAKILLVRGTRTYAAGSLIAGRDYYDASLLKNPKFAKYFADCMSIAEKTKFLQDFDDPDHIVFLEYFGRCYEGKLSRMSKSEQKVFTNRCLEAYVESMKLVAPYLTESLESKIDGALPWSFPKGRARPGARKEQCIDVALRETREETHITAEMLSVQSQLEPFHIDYCDMGARYQFNLYYATTKPNFAFKLDQTDVGQMNEVSAIKWLTREQLGAEPLCDVTRAQLYEKFDAIIENYTDQLQAARAFDMSGMRSALYGPGAKPAVLVKASPAAAVADDQAEQKSKATGQPLGKVKVALYVPPRRLAFQPDAGQKPVNKAVTQSRSDSLDWRRKGSASSATTDQ